VAVKNGATTLVNYKYDALGRRIVENPGTVNDLYYDAAWQILEERSNGVSTATIQYIWSPVYVDALVLRDRSTANNGTLDERLWVQQDANFNVTALVNGSSSVVERYVYDPYGKRTILDASFNTRSSSSYGFIHGFQGLRLDTTSGVYYARNRDLSPTLARWIEPDPIGFSAGDTNLYRFEGNGPVGAVDPVGLDEHELRTIRPEELGLKRRQKAGEVPKDLADDIVNAVRSVSDNAATQAILEGKLRDAYHKGTEKIDKAVEQMLREGKSLKEVTEWKVSQRNALKTAIRDRGNKLVECYGRSRGSLDKPTIERLIRKYMHELPPEKRAATLDEAYRRILESKPQLKADYVARYLKYGGRVIIVADLAVGFYRVISAPPGQRLRQFFREGARFEGAMAGGIAGAQIGAGIGALLGPLGAGIGGILGGIIGAIGGGWGAGQAMDSIIGD
jgi:RHS repeat-associated protein